MAVIDGERRVVAVLMADIAGSTAIGERLGPERSKFLFDEVIRLMSAQIARYDGTVAQLLGDGLLAMFGAPLAHEDDNERAVRAALGIQRALAAYADDVREAYGIELRARIAVNTGPVVVTPEEGNDGRRYNALGDTVNVTARLQALAGETEVTVGPQTAAQIRDCFRLEELGATELRGRHAPIDRYRVVGELESVRPPPDGPLLGRDAELAAVRERLERLADGLGVIISVTGEPGIGKSRLAAEAVEPLRDRVRVLQGRGLSYTEGYPYWPVRELLRDWLGAGATTSEARVRLDLKAALQMVFGSDEDAYPFLAGVMGLRPDAQATEGLREFSREAVHRRSLEAICELFRRLARERPLLVVMEDLQWADEPTLELIELMLELTEREPLGLVLLYRADRERGAWRVGEHARQRYPHRYLEVELRPLSGEVSHQLAQELAEAPLPEPVAELIAQRAGGNPLFVAEALRDLIERGALRRGEGGWEAAVDPGRLQVPALMQGVLQARLDRLDPAARETAAVAAVIGRRFALPLLELLVEPESLAAALSELQRLELIVEERRRPFPEYRFRHGLMQEAAYAGLTDARRKALHARVGEAMEQLAGDDPSPGIFAHLARHFSEADDGRRAADYLIRAGDEARAIYADQEAVASYRRARRFLAGLCDDRRSRETLFKIALVHHLGFNFGEAERAYDEAFSCKTGAPEQLEPTERLVTAMPRPQALAPGLEYISETNALTTHLYRGLLSVDRDLNVMPSLAQNFRVSTDGRSYMFQIRDGARWSDGEPLTAHDFVYTWERMRGLSTVTAFLLEDVDRAEALDDHTLEVTMREPRNYFPYILATPPSYAWPRHLCERDADWYRRMPLVSSGPFVLAEMHDDGMILAANPHWDGPRGNLREIEIRFQGTDDRPDDVWHSGEVDVLSSGRSVIAPGEGGLSEVVPALGTAMVGFRCDRPPFSDPRLRRAVGRVLSGLGETCCRSMAGRPADGGGLLPPAMPGHDHRVSAPISVERARELLAEAGHPDGEGLPPLRLAAAGTPLYRGLAEPVAEALGQLGLQVEFRWTELAACISDLDAHLWVTTWMADYPDPDGFFRGLLNDPHDPIVDDPEILDLLAQARASHDQDQRLRLYAEVDRRLVADQALLVPIAYSRIILLRRPWVHSVWANALTPLRLDEVVVEREG